MAATKINTNHKKIFQIGWIITNTICLFSACIRQNTELRCEHGCHGYFVHSGVLRDVCGA